MSNEPVFGKPVEGSINETSKPVEQADPALLEDALDAVFEFGHVEAVKWDQYTPYFNDGDPCEFGVNGYSTAIKFYGLNEEDDDTYYGDGFYRIEDGLVECDWETEPRWRRVNERLCASVAKIVPQEAHADLIRALNDLQTQLDNGTHEVFLKRAFGDHAQVTATREGFSVDYYEHD